MGKGGNTWVHSKLNKSSQVRDVNFVVIQCILFYSILKFCLLASLKVNLTSLAPESQTLTKGYDGPKVSHQIYPISTPGP